MTENISASPFYNPVKIFTGRGSRECLLKQLEGKNILVVSSQRGREKFLDDSKLSDLAKNNSIVWVDSVKENPGLTDLQSHIESLNSVAIDAIIAFGGGSAMDAAKALRMGIAVNSHNTLLELLSDSSLHKNAKQVPLYTLPTTSGTGSEVTPFATIWHHEQHKKLSLSSDYVFPSVAVVDPELTDTLPLNITLSTGLDAINQAAESIWNKKANSISLALATRSLTLSISALPKIMEGKGSCLERDQMSEASLLAGLAISYTRTALCHSISYPLTSHFGVPHGLACAFTMTAVCELNLTSKDDRFFTLSKALTGENDLDKLYDLFKELSEKLKVLDYVKTYINSLDDLLELQHEMFNPNRAANNLVDLGENDLAMILNKSWG